MVLFTSQHRSAYVHQCTTGRFNKILSNMYVCFAFHSNKDGSMLLSNSHCARTLLCTACAAFLEWSVFLVLYYKYSTISFSGLQFLDCTQLGVRGGLCNPSYWDGGIWGWLVDRKPLKGSKWPAEGPHYTWGSTRDILHTQIPPGQTEFQSEEVRMADWS